MDASISFSRRSCSARWICLRRKFIVKISGTTNQTQLILDSSVSRTHSMSATCLVFLCEGQTNDGDFKFGA